MSHSSNKFSVAMCTYNGERYLQAQLDSIANQTRPPDELVICDDHSGDNTLEIIEDFARTARFPVRSKVNDQTLGSTRNFEQAISSCRGDIIALADQDDVWLPHKLACIEAAMMVARAPGLVFSDAELMTEDGTSTGMSLWEKLGLSPKERAQLRRGSGFEQLLRGSTVTGATVAFRSEFKRLALPIPDDLPVIHDAWIALIVSCVAGIRPMEQPLVLYRQHSEQQVGPQERTSAVGGLNAVITGQAGAAALRKNPYETTLTLARAARTRLAVMAQEFEVSKAHAKIDSLIKHFEARSNLPDSFLRRLLAVAEELPTFRYFQFSNGLTSAAKDLLGKR